MARSVLVVGGAGYIGAHCVRALQVAGDDVVVFDDLSTGHRAAVDCELVVGDIRDRDALARALSRPYDAVIHFAAKAEVGESTRRPLHYFDHNVAGTLALVREMARADVGVLVFSSSCSLYGAPSSVPVTEAHPMAPVSPYGLSKLMVERILEALRAREGFLVTSLRYFNAAGAHPEGDLGESHAPETHLIPLAIATAQGRRPPLKVFGMDYPTPDGTCVRDYVHVQDLASAHRLALDALLAGSPGGAYNLGTGRGSSVLEVIDAVRQVAGRDLPWLPAPRREGDPPCLWADASLARQELGWSPEYTTIEGIVETAWRWAESPRY